MNNPETERKTPVAPRTDLQELLEAIEAFVMVDHILLDILLMEHMRKTLMVAISQPLLEKALTNCGDEAARLWLKENSESFYQLADMFVYLKEKIDKEEKKNHSNNIDIIFVAHGSISPPMIPASHLLPLPHLTDVILYSPWNCVSDANVMYGIATGKMKPEHRKFYCKNDVCQNPSDRYQPSKLPDHWNSLKKAGGQKIPTITVSPLHPESYVWKRYDSLIKKYGPTGRDRVVISFLVPAQRILDFLQVPVYVVTLALSLVLLSSRFKATVHLVTCLSKSSAEKKLDENLLEQQYSWTVNNTGMTVSEDVFKNTQVGFFRRLFKLQ